MKYIFLPLLLFGLIAQHANAQKNEELVGSWNAKLLGYPFQQYGSAKVFTKSLVNGSKQKLEIDKKYKKRYWYTYTDSSSKYPLTTGGWVEILNDTLIFTETNSNQVKYKGSPVYKYYLYHLDSSQLIYSRTEVDTAVTRNYMSESFEPIEVKASYRLGEHKLYKALYNSLALSARPKSKDTAQLNEYTVSIDVNGNLDMASLSAVNDAANYLDAIRKALLRLEGNFIPFKSTGRYVKGKLKLQITY
jgi:hypothetical protein